MSQSTVVLRTWHPSIANLVRNAAAGAKGAGGSYVKPNRQWSFASADGHPLLDAGGGPPSQHATPGGRGCKGALAPPCAFRRVWAHGHRLHQVHASSWRGDHGLQRCPRRDRHDSSCPWAAMSPLDRLFRHQYCGRSLWSLVERRGGSVSVCVSESVVVVAAQRKHEGEDELQRASV